jgi:hypothetical protein
VTALAAVTTIAAATVATPTTADARRGWWGPSIIVDSLPEPLSEAHSQGRIRTGMAITRRLRSTTITTRRRPSITATTDPRPTMAAGDGAMVTATGFADL